MGRLVAITGTPGTGKKSIAPSVAATLGLPCMAMPKPLAKATESQDDFEVDTDKERRAILKHPPEDAVVYGHLLPYVLPRTLVTRAVVLRCDPMVLRERLQKRGYPERKITDNVEAELIGIIAQDAFQSFGGSKASEFDTTGTSPESAARAISGLVRRGEVSSPRIDWLPSYGSARRLKALLSPEGSREG